VTLKHPLKTKPQLVCGYCGVTFTAKSHRRKPITVNYCTSACRLAGTKSSWTGAGSSGGGNRDLHPLPQAE